MLKVSDLHAGYGAVNVGMSFTSSVSGFVTGVRFYKSAANTGTHIGTLWSATGTQLATVTFAFKASLKIGT